MFSFSEKIICPPKWQESLNTQAIKGDSKKYHPQSWFNREQILKSDLEDLFVEIYYKYRQVSPSSKI